jgi:hypothetical protein
MGPSPLLDLGIPFVTPRGEDRIKILMPDTLRWHQSDAENVASWEFQSRRGGEGWEWVEIQETVAACIDCFQVDADLREGVQVVRARSVSTEGVESDWSNVIGVPEPAISSMLAMGCIVLLALSGIARIKRSQRVPRQ